MLEFIFFDERPWREFIDRVVAEGVEPQSSRGDDGLLVALPEALEDALLERIEAHYDELLAYNEALFAESAGEAHVYAAGITINLSDGRAVQAEVDPGVLNRILDAVSTDELGRFVATIVDAVEHPDARPLCRRLGPPGQ